MHQKHGRTVVLPCFFVVRRRGASCGAAEITEAEKLNGIYLDFSIISEEFYFGFSINMRYNIIDFIFKRHLLKDMIRKANK